MSKPRHKSQGTRKIGIPLSAEQLEDWRINSMLYRAALIHADMRSGLGRGEEDKKTFLQRPYARPNPRKAINAAPVWFTAYMASTIGSTEDEKPLATLSDSRLWELFSMLGIKGIHTGPVMKAGGFRPAEDGGLTEYPTIDGWFDPVSFSIDPTLGFTPAAAGSPRTLSKTQSADKNDYERLVDAVHASGGKVIGDVVPGHTGMGSDFHLALRAFGQYPGLYLLVRIDDKMDLLSPAIRDSLMNREYAPHELSSPLTLSEIRELRKKEVIPGSPQRPMGAEAGYGWSITREITGIRGNPSASGPPDKSLIDDPVTRRWVYLHFFNPQQPTLNWIDPGFAAWRLVIGEINYLMWEQHSDGVRLDANSFLGLEIVPDATDDVGSAGFQTWSEAHPLSQMATNMLAWQARRLGGFSFQEMNMALPELAAFSKLGPDLAYDFVTRPACEHALLTGSADLLVLMYAQMEEHDVDPIGLVHALQNHDDFTYELVHLSASGERNLTFGDEELLAYSSRDRDSEGREWPGRERVQATHRATEDKSQPFPKSGAPLSPISIWGRIRSEVRRLGVSGNDFNHMSENGLCTTIPGLIAARVGCKTLHDLEVSETPSTATEDEKRDHEERNKSPKLKREKIKLGHLLLAAFNAFQPGVFAISGWDLVGALPIMDERLDPELLYSGILPSPTDRVERVKDYRWVNRGAYKLLSTYLGRGSMQAQQTEEFFGPLQLPEAQALYGPLDVQAQDGVSFYSQLKRIIAVRHKLGLHLGQFGGTLDFGDPAVFGSLTWLPVDGMNSRTAAVALFNFSRDDVRDVVVRPHILEGWSRHWRKRWDEGGALTLLEEDVAQRERARLRRWRLYDALPSREDYDPTALASRGLALETPIQLEPWTFKLYHLRPLTGALR